MNKKILGSAIVLACAAGVSNSAYAALASNAVLNFSNFTQACSTETTSGGATTTTCTVNGGSYFMMDTDGSGTFSVTERTGITNAGTGLTLGTAQAYGTIDNPWVFFGPMGAHLTLSAPTVASTSGDAATLNMSGWTVNWNGGNINMGTGANAAVTCAAGSGCATGSAFTMIYSATVPDGAFEGVSYRIRMVGTIAEGTNPIPVPAAVWLFGSGLLGLAGVARRRKAA